jgi:hypothetical protein
MLPETKRKQTEVPETASLVEVTRTLKEARDALRGYEVTALAGTAEVLSGTARSLLEALERLEKMRPEEWIPPIRLPVTSDSHRLAPLSEWSLRKAYQNTTSQIGSLATLAPSSTHGSHVVSVSSA